MDRQEFSKLVSLALNSMGYNYETVRQRQVCNVGLFEKLTSTIEDARLILVGSTAEGIAHFFSPNNDRDFMVVFRDIVVFEDTPVTQSCEKDDLKLQMECDNVAPGYTMVKCTCINMKSSAIPNISERPYEIFERNDNYYLRHGLNEELQAWQKDFTEFTEREGETESFLVEISGPAFTFISKLITSYIKYADSIDLVHAIPCLCFSHIRNWVTRTKHYGWPDKELFSKIKNQIGYLVPVGVKRSKNCELEWRICYTEIENILIRSFNETQIKMFVLLKMVAKSILKPICKDITSYVIKNLVNAREIFTADNLTSLVMLGLRSLRNKVHIRLFGNYMIPERNLFAGKITEHEKIETVRVLDEMLAQGPMFLVNFKELNRLKMAIDEANHNPSLAEMKRKVCHECSFVHKIEDEGYELLLTKLLAGIILVQKYLELDERQKGKLQDIFCKSENTYCGESGDLEEDVEQDFKDITFLKMKMPVSLRCASIVPCSNLQTAKKNCDSAYKQTDQTFLTNHIIYKEMCTENTLMQLFKG